jgi:adenylate cyclase
VAPVLVDRLVEWVIAQALSGAEVDAIVMGCCNRLHAIGVPLARGFFSFSVLHPLHRAVGITWHHGEGTRVDDYPHTPQGVTDNYRKSPFFYMRERGLDVLRCRLDLDRARYDFNIFSDLAREGLTDYMAFVIPFAADGDSGLAGSWATELPDGFSDSEIETLARVQRRMAVAIKMAMQRQLMRNLAATYLGSGAGGRVLDGQIKRGDGETIRAAIFSTDLRGSTAMADRLPRQEYIATLNQFFDVVGGAVKSQGGEILSFIGDGMLAIFPTDDGNLQEACRRAYDAAVAAHAGMDALNRERTGRGEAALGFGIGLHEGEVMFGNVGVSDRLTFSVFGAAVNEVSRLDSLTKELGEPVLATDNFAFALPRAWRALGSFELKGVARRVMVLTPRCEAERRGEGHHQRDVPTDE